MKKKRLIGVITIKNNIAVQSFSYKKYLPIGKPEILAKNLDRWGADEILLNVIDANSYNKEPNYAVLEKILNLKLSTPIIYGGGILDVKNALKVIKFGADRILIETILYSDLYKVRKISETLGAQSLVASIPLISHNKNIYQFNYLEKQMIKINNNFIKAIKENLVSEILLTDIKNEGYENSFNCSLLNLFPVKNFPIICFGGISTPKQIIKIIKNKNVNAIAIGNSLNFKENAVQFIKKEVFKYSFRKPFYFKEN
ncbi:HisA/HisF-related TIM barrel protein [Pelagibacteraceae bacterium]|jgi:imidazole glycerol-phosphate synthase subunit HisF|nr:HisA/HisF-related TIM barrel protein [Pelagibacteraceae bacterium]